MLGSPVELRGRWRQSGQRGQEVDALEEAVHDRPQVNGNAVVPVMAMSTAEGTVWSPRTLGDRRRPAPAASVCWPRDRRVGEPAV